MGPRTGTETVRVVTRVWDEDCGAGPVAQARRLVRDVLADVGVSGEDVDDARLMCSELVANAFAHGRGPRALRVRASAEALVCEVLDSAAEDFPAWPTDEPSEALSEHGRGLRLVDMLSHRHGCYLTSLRAVPAKSVWFLHRHERQG